MRDISPNDRSALMGFNFSPPDTLDALFPLEPNKDGKNPKADKTRQNNYSLEKKRVVSKKQNEMIECVGFKNVNE